MEFHLSTTSLARLGGVNPDLVRVVKRAIELAKRDFTVLEGIRTEARQAQLMAQGASKTLKSRHITGHAVDIAPIVEGKIPWDKQKMFVELSTVMFKAADELGVLIQWGGDWDQDGDWRDESFFDGPHFQIPHDFNRKKAEEAQKKRVMVGKLLKPLTLNDINQLAGTGDDR